MIKYAAFIRKKPSVILPALKGMFKTLCLKQHSLRGIELAVTYKCQAACVKCSCRTLTDLSRNEMSVDQITEVAGQAVRMGALLIDLTGGEPLLRPDIVEIVKRLSSLPAIISLASNAVLLSDPLLLQLQRAGLSVLQFGLVSPVAEEHDSETGIKGSFSNLISRIDAAKRLKMEVLLNTVVTKELLYSGRIHKLAVFAAQKRCFLSLVLPAAVGGWQGKDVSLDQKDYARLAVLLRRKYVTIDTETCYRKGVCPAGIEKIYISPYGDVYPCPFIHVRSGNVLELPLSMLLNKMPVSRRCVNIINPRKKSADFEKAAEEIPGECPVPG